MANTADRRISAGAFNNAKLFSYPFHFGLGLHSPGSVRRELMSALASLPLRSDAPPPWPSYPCTRKSSDKRTRALPGRRCTMLINAIRATVTTAPSSFLHRLLAFDASQQFLFQPGTALPQAPDAVLETVEFVDDHSVFLAGRVKSCIPRG